MNWFSPRPVPEADAIQRDALADDGGVGVEQPPPEAVAENDDRRFARLVFFRQQQPAVKRLRAEQVEQARGGRSASTRSGWSSPSSVPVRPCEMDISSNDRFSV